MFYILFFIQISSIYSENLYLDKFYSYMDNEEVLNFEITITQSQFSSNYISRGNFYYIKNNHYVYDTKSKRLTFLNNQITTINKIDNQILYENIVGDTFTIFDIFTAKKKIIDPKGFNITRKEAEIFFEIKELSSSGSLLINSIDGCPKLVKITTEDKMELKLEIENVSTSSKLNLKHIDISQFSVVDLRG